ncbi:MAG TPA: pilus assembly protein TadG-related protein [Sporichthyaceae bacterium]|jgi:Flp pilus assembly protein TadG|nr:pilus assembly protein TadG-related protein [Sporichthyaceae bacterium]
MTGSPRNLRNHARRDCGSATVFVVVLVPALLAMAGLVIDGGYALSARQQADTIAEQAARAGADQLAINTLRAGGPIRLNPAAARTAAENYLAETGHTGTATVSGVTVTVTVRIARRTAALSAIGINTVSATSTATATGLTGIDQPDGGIR